MGNLLVVCEKGHRYVLQPGMVLDGIDFPGGDADFCRRCGSRVVETSPTVSFWLRFLAKLLRWLP